MIAARIYLRVSTMEQDLTRRLARYYIEKKITALKVANEPGTR
jgi:DNA invertase Pin-like site-specific DNA recombinase